MKHPSIRLRLMLGTGLLVAVVLFVANFAIYRAFEKTLLNAVETQLLQSASLLAKSAELEEGRLDYEWEEAMEMPGAPEITGIFQFWDLNSSRITKSPDLGKGNLPLFYGNLNEPVLRDIVLQDGRKARAVGLLHYPFTDEEAVLDGRVLRPEDYPQVVVCVVETESLANRLSELRAHLTRGAIGTLLAIWAAIFAISTWSLRPLRKFSDALLERSEKSDPSIVEIPSQMPSELIGLASAFNTALDRVEKSRAREKEFALHAAHELRTPVAGILATLEQAIHRPRESEDLSNRISEAIEITSGMRVTLDSLMRLARLRGGLEISSKTDFDPLQIIGLLLDSTKDSIQERGLKLIETFPTSTRSLNNDPGLFRALISNLIENAIHHSPSGSVVEFSISDTPDRFIFTTRNPCDRLQQKDLERLFQPFQRASVVVDEKSGHAGLGLSLAREAAYLLNGSVQASIDSEGQILFTAELLRR